MDNLKDGQTEEASAAISPERRDGRGLDTHRDVQVRTPEESQCRAEGRRGSFVQAGQQSVPNSTGELPSKISFAQLSASSVCSLCSVTLT